MATDEIESVLASHGERFAGNNVRDEADDWRDHDFTAAQVDEWCEIGVWDAGTAAAWRDAGLTPFDVQAAADSLVESLDDPSDEFTDGDPIYSCCNGDTDPAVVIAAVQPTLVCENLHRWQASVSPTCPKCGGDNV